jgi:uncharacterized protein
MMDPTALTDAEIERLDRYLVERALDAGGLPNLEALDGFLSAVIVAPRLLPPSTWMEFVWGPEHAFADAAEAEALIGLLMRLYQTISARIAIPPLDRDAPPADERLPIIDWSGLDHDEEHLNDLERTDSEFGAAWALGFSAGRALCMADWERRCADWEGLEADLLEVDRLLAVLERSEGHDDPDAEMTLAERIDIIARVPDLLHDLSQDPPVLEPVRRTEPKIGRNDPCPCGSGRKYKKCHGAG